MMIIFNHLMASHCFSFSVVLFKIKEVERKKPHKIAKQISDFR